MGQAILPAAAFQAAFFGARVFARFVNLRRKAREVRRLVRTTYSGDTLKYVKTKTHKNVTIRLAEPLLRRFRAYAAGRNQSMSNLMTRAIEKLMEHDEEYEKTKRRAIERMHNAPDLGTNGKIPWKREDLYDR